MPCARRARERSPRLTAARPFPRRCSIVTDIGVCVTNPQACDKELIEQIMAESMAEGEKVEEWKPHEASGSHATAGGQMAA